MIATLGRDSLLAAGGWVLDFIQGKVMRTHSDIDLVAWKDDAQRLRGLILPTGFVFVRDTGVQ